MAFLTWDTQGGPRRNTCLELNMLLFTETGGIFIIFDIQLEAWITHHHVTLRGRYHISRSGEQVFKRKRKSEKAQITQKSQWLEAHVVELPESFLSFA